jgi:hypothetical protein
MKYTKPQLLNTKAASDVIKGQPKPFGSRDSIQTETVGAYRSDE